MRLRVICIGDEILLGHTLNSNLAYLGDKLHEYGYTIEREVCIPDTAEMIRRTVRQELDAADAVLTVGGLGPTVDDVTRPVIAEELGLALELDQEVLARIRRYLAGRRINIPDEAMRTQAMVPQGAQVLYNTNGTAPGLWCAAAEKAVVMLPGPPRELQPMFEESVLPRLREHLPPTVATTTIHTCGIPESQVAAQVEDVLAAFPDVAPAFCARSALVDIRLTTAAQEQEQLQRAENAVRSCLGTAVFPKGAVTLPEAVGEELARRGMTVAVAESCTGGGIGAAFTETPGSSAYFAGGIIAYSNTVKQQLLDVSAQTLAQHGAVSEAVAREMARGVICRFNTTTGIAVTGVAGPSGGTSEKPVGLVYIATACERSTQVQPYQFPGNRKSVRERTITMALNQLRLQLQAT